MQKIINEDLILQQALEIDGESARVAFIERACTGAPASRKRLCQLLADYMGSDSSLEETQACAFTAGTMVDVPDVGSSIGPYKLLQELGEGGMGVVFLAQQEVPVKRSVALKVIKIGMDTRRVVARFESERQAMALMDHPCITRIYDAGATDSGRPYFVMELVQGNSITSYCDEHRLSLRQRLEVFVQVCNALEHAHQKGIIHRDIKPNNILVTNHDGRPTPKIIDFGIAKAVNDPLTEETSFTNYGEMVGTPLYMSPEQSELSEHDVDTRTDIYSLGVLLYELLTGTTPYHELKRKSFHEIRKAIRSHDPQLASTRINNLGDTVKQISTDRDTDVQSLRRFVRGELDWILTKCLARDRNDRYQSAGELSREIVRYLNGELVEAAAPTWRYRSRKFIARHKTGVAVAAAFVAILVAATVFSTMMAVKANSAQQLASTRLEVANKERDRALFAEQQLAELERKQRNRVAIHQAASSHNAVMVKKYLAENSGAKDANKRRGRPEIQVQPLKSYWSPTSRVATSRASVVSAQAESDAVGTMDLDDSNWMFEDDRENGDIEVIVLSNENENKESLLKSILQHQKEAFGDHDVLVAQTLNKLGEITSSGGNWMESEKYFRQAVEILKQTANDERQLAAVRGKLAAALEKKGDLEKLAKGIHDIKESLERSEFNGDISGLFESIKRTVRRPQNSDERKFD